MKKIALCLALFASLPACGGEPKTLQEVDSRITKLESRDRLLIVVVTADDMETAVEPIFKAIKWQTAHGWDGLDNMKFSIRRKNGESAFVILTYKSDDMKKVNWKDSAGPTDEEFRGTVLSALDYGVLLDEGSDNMAHFCKGRVGSSYEGLCAKTGK